jgi:hypothetical protein
VIATEFRSKSKAALGLSSIVNESKRTLIFDFIKSYRIEIAWFTPVKYSSVISFCNLHKISLTS